MSKYDGAKKLATKLYYEEGLGYKQIGDILWRPSTLIEKWIEQNINELDINKPLREHWKNRSLRLCHVGYDVFYRPLKYKGKTYNQYCVSYDGCVFSRNKTTKWSKLKGGKDKEGYWEICIKHNNRQVKLHRCIYESFTTKDVTDLLILHKDDNKNNNCLTNLYSGTHKNNGMDRVKNGLSPKGNRHGRKTITEKQAREISEVIISEDYDYLTDLVKRFGVKIGCIYSIKIGNAFRWMFSEDELKKMKEAKGRIGRKKRKE